MKKLKIAAVPGFFIVCNSSTSASYEKADWRKFAVSID
jgi:hypothetical protein